MKIREVIQAGRFAGYLMIKLMKAISIGHILKKMGEPWTERIYKNKHIRASLI